MTVQFCTQCSSTYGIPLDKVVFTTIGDTCDVCRKTPFDGCHLAHPDDYGLISEIIMRNKTGVSVTSIEKQRSVLPEDDIQDEITAELEITHKNFKVIATSLMYDDLLPFKDLKKGSKFTINGFSVIVDSRRESLHPRGYKLVQLFLKLSDPLPADPEKAYSNITDLQKVGDWFLNVYIKKRW